MLLSVTSSKGGAGKTTLLTLLGTTIFSYYGKKVILVDIDPQGSLSYRRKKDLELLKKLPENSSIYKSAKENHKRWGAPFCMVARLDISQDFQHIKSSLEEFEKEFDLVIVDFPGSLNINENVLKIMYLLDYVFIPFYVDDNSFYSAWDFYNSLEALRMKNKIHLTSYAFFNYYTEGKEKNAGTFQKAYKVFEDAGIRFLSHNVYYDIDLEDYSSIRKITGIQAPKSIFHWIEEIYYILFPDEKR